MLRYGFFDSEITGFDEEGMPIFDRAESSDFLAMFISQIISDGVLALPGDAFQVIAYEGMTLKVRPGFGIVRGRFAMDTRECEIYISKAPSAYKRIDRVVLRANYLQRLCEIVVKEGTPSANPEPPELIRPAYGDYYELCLAMISINSNQTLITQANITDTRYNSDVCGLVTQLIDHLDTSVFFAQLNQFYKEFVDRSNATYEEFKQQAINLYNFYIEATQALYKEFEENGQKEYDGFHAEITEYIEDLKDRGDTKLAAITQQLLDFRNTNEDKFLSWMEEMKDKLNQYPAGKILQQIEQLQAQQEDMREMLLTGMVYTKLATDDSDYITDDMGNALLVGWPICRCNV